ncbi:MAG TPA: hypothetical protein VEI96_10225 [Thermodesulfovibrionales bacterium]|nr:hypothetical protein [Thermodesulfovibrionales bacterium]
MKKISCIVFLVLMILGSTVPAQETDSGEAVPEVKAPEVAPAGQEMTSEERPAEEVYTFPKIKPEISLFGGYRFVNVNGSPTADQYEYLHNSLAGGGELRVFSFPNRLHLDVDVNNEKDYYGDLSYSYKDLILFRGISRSLFQNLPNILLIDLNPVPIPTAPTVDVRDPGVEYGVRTGINTASLRLKMPDFPLHFYVDGGLIEKNGLMQQLFLGGSGSFNNIVRVSQARNIDLDTKTFTIGANSHLGPIEIDYAHGEERFSPGGQTVLYDAYNASLERPAGVFPHNLIPGFDGSSNTVKIHTNYTGGLVLSATLTQLESKNNDSGAKADYLIGYGAVTWVPMPQLAVFLKYKYREADIDNPALVSLTDITNPANTFIYPVKPSISSINNTISGTVRYKPFSPLTLWANYTYGSTTRENAALWNLPVSTYSNVASFWADVRLMKNLTLKARYVYTSVDNPPVNTVPNNSNAGSVQLSWIPVPAVNALFTYNISSQKRDDLSFTDTTDALNRSVKVSSVVGSVTFLILKDLSATASYAYMHNNTTQDIAFQDLASNVNVDPNVPFEDMTHNYGLTLTYLPKENLNLNAGVNYTTSSGGFFPSDPALLQPVSVAAFSLLNTRETLFFVSGEYRFKCGYALGLRYQYSDLNNVNNNPYGDVQDGRAQIIYVTLAKRW